MVWTIIQDELPGLKNNLNAILKEESKKEEGKKEEDKKVPDQK